MNTNNVTKFLAVAAAAVLVLPSAASAHGLGFGLSAKSDLQVKGLSIEHDAKVRAEANKERKEHKENKEHTDKKEHSASASATSTASAITKAGARLQNAATFLGSLSATLAAQISSSSAQGNNMATATARLTHFNTSVAGIKTEAAAALTAAGQVNVTNSTSTNAALITEARADLKAARNFLRDARRDLMAIFHKLWNVGAEIGVSARLN